jgi:Sel1 repeat
MLLSSAAEEGDEDAQYNLGVMYQYGKGVETNPVKAVEWYQKGIFFVNYSKYQHTQRVSSISR